VAFLEIDHVTKHFPAPDGRGALCVFRDVAFAIEEGEFLTMIGHSGCGKSTLLNIIAGLERPSEGGVVLEGREVARPGMDRMVVFQNFSLMPWMTVVENVRLAVRAAHPDWSRRALLVRERCEERFLDVRYEELVADPLAQVARIYAFAGLSLPESVRERMRRWAKECFSWERVALAWEELMLGG